MKLNQMRAFRELMITGTVSQAARNLHRTQPSVSALVAGLEDEIGMSLFERRNGRLHPIPEAWYLFDECTELLQRLGRVSQNMKLIRKMESGELNIVSSLGPSIFLIPELIARLGQSHPEIKTTLMSRSSDAVFELMAGQRYDIGVADYDSLGATTSGLMTFDVFQFDCLCAIPGSSDLADREIITPGDLENRSLATLYKEHQTYRGASLAFANAGVDMNIRFMAQHFAPLVTYVEKGIAHAIVDPIMAESYQLYTQGGGQVIFRRLEPVVTFELVVIRPSHRPASVIAQHFTDTLLEEFSRIAGVWS